MVIIRPLDRLTKGAAEVAGGDLAVDLPVLGGGEVADLTKVFNHMVARLRQGREELERLSVTDGLTGLFNRRYLIEHLASEVSRSRRNHHSFAVLMMDVDHFKTYNDTHGHLAGDEVLVRVSRILRESIRDVDFPTRYGGEEFLVLLPETSIERAVEVAERIRTRLASETFAGGRITLSAGVASFPEFGETAEAVIMCADVALYEAKREGRDRVVRATSQQAPLALKESA
jgi:diguanylate cyclase (GGDEF)-like protein